MPSALPSALPQVSRPQPSSRPKLAAKAKKKTATPLPRPSALPTHLPEALQKLEKKYAEAVTLEANFSQVADIQSTRQKKTTSGKIHFKRPGKIRWETLAPVGERTTLTGNGKKFWFYTPPFDEGETGQVIERKSSAVQSQLAEALLSGSFSLAKDMKIQQESPTLFILTPHKKASGGVRKAQLELDPEEGLIQKVIVEYQGGNRTEIKLSDIQLGTTISDDTFDFVVPSGTDIVGE